VNASSPAASEANIDRLAGQLRKVRGITDHIVSEAADRLRSAEHVTLLKRAWYSIQPTLQDVPARSRVRGRRTEAIDKPIVAKRRAMRVGEAIHAMTLQADEPRQHVFNSGVLIQSTLPHRDPGTTLLAWSRKNGNTTLRIQPLIEEINGEQVASYPYGTYPRLILFWAVTEVQRLEAAGKDSRVLHLGQSLTEFMRAIGAEKGGKQTRMIAEQAKRLFGAQITYTAEDLKGENGKKSVGLGIGGVRVSDEAEFWWNPVSPDQSAIFPNYVRLSERFHGYLKSRSYPMDVRIISALQDSSLALDLYAFLTYRVYGLNESVVIPWASLAKQLGADYDRARDFADNARKHLHAIQALWPALRLDEAPAVSGLKGSALVIHPSPPSVLPKEEPTALLS
jgi:hypothetical protein